MEITVIKYTDEELLRDACSETIDAESKISLDKIYRCMHSPIRTQMFKVRMKGIKTFVSVHFVRHSIGVVHYVKSNREDRGGNGTEDRHSPVNHTMWINAEALINMSRKRLCFQAHIETVNVMKLIKEAIKITDPALYPYLVPECHFRNGHCPELRSCGRYKVVTSMTPVEITRMHPDWVEV